MHFEHNTNERPLIFALGITLTILLVQIAGAIFTKSLALLSDATHMSTDVMALAIALIALRISRKVADTVRTFGYHRFEVIAAAFNTLMLFAVAVFIFWEAYQRVGAPASIHSTGMLVVAGLGLLANLASLFMLHPSKDHNLNLKGAYLEVLSDMLASLGVIIAAIIIKLTGWAWVDSVVAIIIAAWILPRAWGLLKESVNVLLEGIPKGIELGEVERAMMSVPGVENIHELHVWAISSGKICLTAHVVLTPQSDCETALIAIRKQLAQRFKISHTTLQHERERCLNDDDSCDFGLSKGK